MFVQVRPASDALYASALEPWSEYLTGKAGQAPRLGPAALPGRRGAQARAGVPRLVQPLPRLLRHRPGAAAPDHLARLHPDWIVSTGASLYYNPGLPQVRDHVTTVVKDVVSRYDIDGVHFDDYFYPYPVGGATFADDAAFKKTARAT